jgi:hypothetical protein
VVRFALLATTLVLSLAVLMIASPLMESRLLVQVAMYAPLVIGVYVLSENARFAVAWTASLALTVLIGIVAAVRSERALLIADVGLRCLLSGVLMFWVAREMLREARVSLDTILGGICLYILIGYAYALVYVMLALSDPNSLLTNGQPMDITLHATHPFQTVPTLFYFSFTAFTTMGFGDIVPASALARFVTITEGMLGQLFPAIFIARLVSLNLAQGAGPPTDG